MARRQVNCFYGAFYFAVGLLVVGATTKPHLSSTEILQMVDPSNYDKARPPGDINPGYPVNSTEIRLGLYINAMELYPERHVMEVYMYMRQAWQDTRLAFDCDKYRNSATYSPDVWKKIWRPDTFFRNSKTLRSYSDLEDERLLRVNCTGHVWAVIKLGVDFTCYGLQHRAFRSFSCPIMMESFSYTMDHIYLSWLSSPVDIDPSVSLPRHLLYDLIQYDCSQNYTAGSFPCLSIHFHFRASDFQSYSVIVAYVISFIVVLTSWLGFWLPETRMCERLVLPLLCTCILVLTSIGSTIFAKGVSVMQPVDLWLAGCVVFVLGTLVEFILVHCFRLSVRPKINSIRRPTESEGSETAGEVGTYNQMDIQDKAPGGAMGVIRILRIIDVACAVVVFPLLFLLFNIGFWSTQISK